VKWLRTQCAAVITTDGWINTPACAIGCGMWYASCVGCVNYPLHEHHILYGLPVHVLPTSAKVHPAVYAAAKGSHVTVSAKGYGQRGACARHAGA
jgi:hypothetical protein